MSGKSAVIDRINAILPGMTRDDEGVELVLSRLKELEQQGYQFEGADGSFEILVRRILKPYDSFFELERFRLVSELSVGSSDGRITTAMIKISSAGVEEITAAEGNGPVNALDSALRKALEKFYPRLGEMRLSDYKVRVFGMGAATASKVRVLIESTDGHRIWNTVGVSSDIIEASWIALLDSVENKLIHDQLEQEN
jgi:2-isopropylmalate synthase